MLRQIRSATGLSVSAALKLGLAKAAEDLEQRASAEPYAIYQALDLGPGGYAAGPARLAKSTLKAVLQRKHRR